FSFLIYVVRVTWLKDVSFKPPENMLQPTQITESAPNSPVATQQNSPPATPTPTPPSLDERVKAFLEGTKQYNYRDFSSHTQPLRGTMRRLIKVNGEWVRERPDGIYNTKGARIYNRDERAER